jgi:DNA-binding NarL/FixJ family response regulator
MAQQHLIFLVDDDKMLLEMLDDHLQESLNFPVETKTFSNGEACLAHLHLQPEVIVLDYHFVDTIREEAMSGADILKNLKSQTPETSVIMLSSDKDLKKVRKTLDYDADAYVIKDDDAFEKVSNNIEDILERSEKLARNTKLKKIIGGVAIIAGLALLGYFLTFFW